MIQYEEERENHQAQLDEKDRTINKLEQRVNNIEKGMQQDEALATANLNGMADLEAKLAFVQNEKNEMQQELDYVR